MLRRRAAFGLVPLLALAAFAAPAAAIVGGTVERDPDGLRRFVVRVEVPRRELCSGVLIAADLVLTAAHCVAAEAGYRVVAADRAFRPRPMAVRAVVAHPGFVPGKTPTEQGGIDLALVLLERPVGQDFSPLDPAAAAVARRGDKLVVAGFGIAAEDDSRAERILRQARLSLYGLFEIGKTVRVFADDAARAASPGAGACHGDSGGPLLQWGAAGYRLVAIVSWSSGALDKAAAFPCGGLTGATPAAEHVAWIASAAQALHGLPQPANRARRSGQPQAGARR